MTILISALVALVVFVGGMIFFQTTQKQSTMRERLGRIAGSNENDQRASQLDNPLPVDHEPTPLAQMCEKLVQLLGTNTEVFRRDAALRFYRAGIQDPDAPIYYLFFKRYGMVVCLIIAVILAYSAPGGLMSFGFYIMAATFTIIGFFGADLYITNSRAKREKVLQRSFPDALDLLLVCVESGLALDGALARVCKEMARSAPEITTELNRTRLELTLLNDRIQALNNLAERTDMLSFRSLVTTLQQSEKFGTTLTDTLRVLSEDYRMTRLMVAENKAGRLPALMTIPLILFMMPAFFLVILGPTILKLLGILHNS